MIFLFFASLFCFLFPSSLFCFHIFLLPLKLPVPLTCWRLINSDSWYFLCLFLLFSYCFFTLFFVIQFSSFSSIFMTLRYLFFSPVGASLTLIHGISFVFFSFFCFLIDSLSSFDFRCSSLPLSSVYSSSVSSLPNFLSFFLYLLFFPRLSKSRSLFFLSLRFFFFFYFFCLFVYLFIIFVFAFCTAIFLLSPQYFPFLLFSFFSIVFLFLYVTTISSSTMLLLLLLCFSFLLFLSSFFFILVLFFIPFFPSTTFLSYSCPFSLIFLFSL